MYIIKESIANEIIIKKSKFITFLIYIDDKENFTMHLTDIKNKCKNATHYCYAYIIDNYMKYSDDNEPSNTAGVVILNALLKRNINRCLCIVVRYFGGIKLGKGGLIRSYSNSVLECINKANLVTYEEMSKLEITFVYDNKKEIDNLLNDYYIYNKSFLDNVSYIVSVPRNNIIIEHLKKLSVKIKEL